MLQLIVPPATHGGVYDFSRKVQAGLGADSCSLVHLSKVNARLWNPCSEDVVILQMSGYGYQKRGVPLWLLDVIRERKSDMKAFGVFFHELFAFGPPWSSSFWLSPIQRLIARELVEISDFWMTNREGSRDWILRYGSNKPNFTMPVFSNVGELESPSAVRKGVVIVFGGAALRSATYAAARSANFFSWAKANSLEIHDIGEPIEDSQVQSFLERNGVFFHGRLSQEDIRRTFSTAMLGLLAYPVEYISKSGVFAAYSAYGVCPVVFSENHQSADGLIFNFNYLKDFSDRDSNALAWANVGQKAWSWYQSHSLNKHLATLDRFIKDIG